MNDSTSNNAKHQGKIRIYLADDHEIFRTGLRTVLRFAGEIEITGESGIVPDLLSLIENAEPDIVLIGTRSDISKLTEQIKDRFPAIKILVLGSLDSGMPLSSAARLNGYIKKESTSEFLRSAIKTISLGGTAWSPDLLTSLIESAGNSRLSPESNSTGLTLTPREKQLLSLLADGKTNKQISLELHLAQITVKKALQTLFVKIGGTNRTQTVMKASQLGLI